MRLTDLFQVMITEAPMSAYLPMIEKLKAYPASYKQVLSMTTWARKTLVKRDRVVWYVSLARVAALVMASRRPKGEDENLRKLLRIYAAPLLPIYGSLNAMPTMEELWNFQVLYQHYVDMDIPVLNDYQVSGKTPKQVLADFEKISQDWTEKHKSTLDATTGANMGTIIIEMPDGSQWVDLGVSGCKEEGTAMGHCGNGVGRPTQTMLSYRIPVDKKGEQVTDVPKGYPLWKPCLTFIFDKATGCLGEMKGRNNSKPLPKYHPAIVELLKQPFIHGVIGGGYRPSANFSMYDLDSQTRASLYAANPELIPLAEYYRKTKEKITPDLKIRIERFLRTLDIDVPVELREYDEQPCMVVYRKDLLADLSGSSYGNASKAADTLEDPAFYAEVPSGPDFVESVFSNIKRNHPDCWKEIQVYIISQDAEDVGYYYNSHEDAYAPSGAYSIIDRPGKLADFISHDPGEYTDLIENWYEKLYADRVTPPLKSALTDWLATAFDNGSVTFDFSNFAGSDEVAKKIPYIYYCYLDTIMGVADLIDHATKSNTDDYGVNIEVIFDPFEDEYARDMDNMVDIEISTKDLAQYIAENIGTKYTDTYSVMGITK